VMADILACDTWGNGCQTDPQTDYLCGEGESNTQCKNHLCTDGPEVNGHAGHNDLADTCTEWCDGVSPYNSEASTCDAYCHSGAGGTWCDDEVVYCECLEVRRPS
jgi:hypothetical protein